MAREAADRGRQRFLERAIELSASFRTNSDYTPFGAVLVLDGAIIGEGVSSPLALHDPTAHAEMLALREGGRHLGLHQFPGSQLYVSGFPCPMCVVACRWAAVERIDCASTLADSEQVGFEDASYYRDLADPAWIDSYVGVVDSLRLESRAVLQEWQLSFPGS